MLRRNYQPSSSGGSTSSDSDDEEKENVTAASENGEGKERGVQTPDVDRDSVTDKNTLLFPFLRDHGLESRPLCRYFNLTLGASMSREGNEGHAKTIQLLYPEWFDPRFSKEVRQSQHSASMMVTPVSDRLCFKLSHNTTPSPTQASPPAGLSQTAKDNQRDVSKPNTNRMPKSSTLTDLYQERDKTFLIDRENKFQISGIAGDFLESRLESSLEESPVGSTSSKRIQDNVTDPIVCGKIPQSPACQFPAASRSRKTGISCNIGPAVVSSREDKSSVDSSLSIASPDTTDSVAHLSRFSRRAQSLNNVLSVSTPRIRQALEKPANRKASLEFTKLKCPASWQKISPIPSPFLESSSVTSSPRNRKWSVASSLERRNSAIDRLLSGSDSLGSSVSSTFDSTGLVIPRRRRLSKKISNTSLVLTNTVEESPISQALNRFCNVVRTVRIITSVCIALKSYVKKHITTGWTFVEMYLHLQNDLTPSLAFDPNSFSKVQPPKGGRRLERLLSVPPERRTPLDIQNILAFVRSHETFQHFPSHLQVKLCMVMHYQRYEPRRIILREGHPPSAFYLVLSGSLIANISETSPTTGQTFLRTVADVTEGECFGEIALLERTPRTASIVCKTRSELLVIYKDDFETLILQPLIEQKKTDVEYCVKHALFEEFDESVFYANPQEFFYQYFPKDTVIVKESNTCPFLILVKSGICKVVGTYRRSDYGIEGSEFSTDLTDTFPLYSEMRKMGLAKDPWERTVEPESDSAICEGLEEALLMGSIDKHTLRKALDATARPSTTRPGKKRPEPVPRHRSSTLSDVFDRMEQERKQMEKDLGADSDPARTDYWSKRLRGSQIVPLTRSRKLGRRRSQMWKLIQQETRSYAEIAALNEGCVFGLETMVSVPGSSVTLVSEGVECLMVSKRLFLEHANIRSLRVAGDMVMTFPSAETLESKVKENRKWKRYKSDMVHQIMSHGVTV